MRNKHKLRPERNTTQKKAILNYLGGVKTHPTAQMVYGEVKEHLPRISLGTVYRNLEFLVKKGSVLKITSGATAHYDGDVSEHGHFICEQCGRVQDVFGRWAGLNRLRLKIGTIRYARVYFFGLCKKC